jgi:uncharacterized protein (DUF2147 family)
MKTFIAAIALSLTASAAVAAAEPDPSPEGRWLTEKKGAVVEISRCVDGTLCGRLIWFRLKSADKNPEALDLNNPVPERRNQSLCGLTVLYGFKPVEPGKWEDGTVYDPRDGTAYNATMRLLVDGTLRLRGYIGISLIGASETWTRFNQPPPQCPTR